jgi:hypothetical protein
LVAPFNAVVGWMASFHKEAEYTNEEMQAIADNAPRYVAELKQSMSTLKEGRSQLDNKLQPILEKMKNDNRQLAEDVVLHLIALKETTSAGDTQLQDDFIQQAAQTKLFLQNEFVGLIAASASQAELSKMLDSLKTTDQYMNQTIGNTIQSMNQICLQAVGVKIGSSQTQALSLRETIATASNTASNALQSIQQANEINLAQGKIKAAEQIKQITERIESGTKHKGELQKLDVQGTTALFNSLEDLKKAVDNSEIVEINRAQKTLGLPSSQNNSKPSRLEQ